MVTNHAQADQAMVEQLRPIVVVVGLIVGQAVLLCSGAVERRRSAARHCGGKRQPNKEAYDY